MTMPKYTGSELCPKCGTAATRASHDSTADELELICPKCEHRWRVRPLDDPEP